METFGNEGPADQEMQSCEGAAGVGSAGQAAPANFNAAIEQLFVADFLGVRVRVLILKRTGSAAQTANNAPPCTGHGQ